MAGAKSNLIRITTERARTTGSNRKLPPKKEILSREKIQKNPELPRETARPLGIKSIKPEALRSAEKLIEELRILAPKDRNARELLRTLENAGPAERTKILDLAKSQSLKTGERKLPAERLLDLYKQGIKTSDLNTLRNPALEQTSTKQIIQIMEIGNKVESLEYLTELGNLKIPELTVRSGSLRATHIPEILTLTKTFSHDKTVVSLAKNFIIEIAKSYPKESSQLLAKALSESTANSSAEIIRTEIIAKALAETGKQGINALISSFSTAKSREIKTIISQTLIASNFKAEIISDPQSRKGLISIMLEETNNVQLAVKMLRGLGITEQTAKSNQQLIILKNQIMKSDSEVARNIASKTEAYIESVKNELKKIWSLVDRDSLELTMVLKAVLVEYGIELSKSKRFEEAEAVLEKADKLGEVGQSIPEIRYAIAFNYFGLGNTAKAMENLTKAIELDSAELTEMLMSFERIGSIGDEHRFTDLAKHFKTIQSTEKATALYTLGYLTNNKYSHPELATIFLQTLMKNENKSLWIELGIRLEKSHAAFQSLIDDIAASVKQEETKRIGNITVLPRNFSARVQDAIDQVKVENNLEQQIAA